MNDQVLREFCAFVDRVVRPVRARFSEKVRMRDELLAHLSAAFEEQLAQDTDERQAIDQAMLRLGNPTELTRQLQSTVPTTDRIYEMIDRIWARPGESWVIRALRQGMVINVLIVIALLIPWLLAGAPMRQMRLPGIWRRITPALVMIVLSAAAFPFFASWMQRVLRSTSRRLRIGIVLIAVTCGLLLLAASFWLDGPSLWDQLGALAFGIFWFPVALNTMARTANARQAQEEQWLQIPT